jgi:uncharacterized ion transporter superfamily protein YfcC
MLHMQPHTALPASYIIIIIIIIIIILRSYALPIPEGRAGIAWEPSKPEI